MALHWKSQEANDTLHKLLRTQTTQMTHCFWHIHQLKSNPCCIVWCRQQVASASMWIRKNGVSYMCFNQKKHINGGSLKLEDKFVYLGNSISSSENDINTRLSKTWTAIDRLSIIWMSDLSDKIKRIFSKQRLCQFDMIKPIEKKTRREFCTRMLRAIFNKSWNLTK